MNDATYQRLKEESWRRPLTPAERGEIEACLAANPQLRADWEQEAGLTLALEKLPDAPVPSNFTALVLQKVEREVAFLDRRRRRIPWWGRFGWARMAAAASVVMAVGFLAFQQDRAHTRAEMARSVVEVSNVASLPPAWLEDFEAIHRLSQTPRADDELLLALLE